MAFKAHVDFLKDDAHWRGEIGPAFTDEDWSAWFASYTSYMLQMAQIAADEKVELFIVGTELITTEGREADWRSLIAKIRAVTKDIKLVYGANWDPGPSNIAWWDALDLWGWTPITRWRPILIQVCQRWSLRGPIIQYRVSSPPRT